MAKASSSFSAFHSFYFTVLQGDDVIRIVHMRGLGSLFSEQVLRRENDVRSGQQNLRRLYKKSLDAEETG